MIEDPLSLLQYPYHIIITYAIIAWLGYQDYKKQRVDWLPLLLLACISMGHLALVLPTLNITLPYLVVFAFFFALIIAMFILAIKFRIVIMTITDYAALTFMLFALIDALPVFIFHFIFSCLLFSLLKHRKTVVIEKQRYIPFLTVLATSIPTSLLFIFIANFILKIA
jgi:hypothetical protein